MRARPARTGARRTDELRQGRLARALRPVRSWRVALAGSLAWAAAMAGAAGMALGRITGWIDPHLKTILAVYFLGGLAAFVPSVDCGRSGGNGQTRRGALRGRLRRARRSAPSRPIGVVYGFQHMRDDIDWTYFPGPAFPFLDIPKSMIGALVLLHGPRRPPARAGGARCRLLLASLWIARRLR